MEARAKADLMLSISLILRSVDSVLYTVCVVKLVSQLDQNKTNGRWVPLMAACTLYIGCRRASSLIIWWP